MSLHISYIDKGLANASTRIIECAIIKRIVFHK